MYTNSLIIYLAMTDYNPDDGSPEPSSDESSPSEGIDSTL